MGERSPNAWARKEWEPQRYQRPAHRLQLVHEVVGPHLIDMIKVWTTANGLKDQAILWPRIRSPLGPGPAPRSSDPTGGKRSAGGPAAAAVA